MVLRQIFIAGLLLFISLTAAAQDSIYRRRAAAGGAVSTYQAIIAGTQYSQLASDATRYIPPMGSAFSVGGGTTAGSRAAPWIAGEFTFMDCHFNTDGLNDAMDDGESTTITLVKNGVDTALTTSMTGTTASNTDRDCASVSTTVTVAEGDLIEWKITTVGSLETSGTLRILARFVPTTPNRFVYSSVETARAAAGRKQMPSFYSWGTSVAQAQDNQFLVPIAGQFTKILVGLSSAQLTGSTVVGVTQNNASWPTGTSPTLSALTCTITSGTSCSGTSALTVSAGDIFGLDTVLTGTPTGGTSGITLVWEPTTSGDYFISPGTSRPNGMSSTLQTYCDLFGVAQCDSLEWKGHSHFLAYYEGSATALLSVKGFMAKTRTAVTAGQSFTYELEEFPTVNGPAQSTKSTVTSCVIDDTCVTGPCTCSASFGPYTPLATSTGPSYYQFAIVPAGSPSVTNAQTAIAIHVGQ
jgi:hypothetical protein